MTGRPDNPFDEAPAAWAMWRWVSARVSQEEAWEFNELMRDYRDEIRAEATGETAIRALALPQTMALHSLTGKLIDQAQSERWTAAGRCGTCGHDGDRAGCQDCRSGES